MKIKSLKIENFRQYKGPININFSQDKHKNFTIIEGTNGTGKTTLLNAITWCLYGEELHKNDDSPIYNNIIKNKTNPGEKFKVLVELEIIDDKGKNVIISRQGEFTKDDNGNIIPPAFGMPSSVVMNINGENKSLDVPELYIERNLPENIENYFFFDGEKLEEYFDENSGNAIKKAVFNISQLNLFDNLNKSLNRRLKEFNKELSKIDTVSGDISTEISELRLEIEDKETKKKKAQKDKNESEKKLNDFRKALSETNEDYVKNLKNDQKLFEEQSKRLQEQLVKKENKKMEYVVELFPLIFSYKNFLSVEKYGDSLRKKRFIPPKFKYGFLEDILNDKKCICGTQIIEGSDEHKAILELIKETSTTTNFSEEINILLHDIEEIKNKSHDFLNVIGEFNEELREYEIQIGEYDEKIEAIKLELDKIDEAKIRRLLDKIKDYERIRDESISTISECDTEIKFKKARLDKLEKKRAKYKINSAKAKELRNKINFIERAIDLCKNLSNNISKNIQKKIEEKTNEQFKRLMWKEYFDKISIDDDYNIVLYSSNGESNSPSMLSAGEELVLALSFVSSLHLISGFNLPLIIDTPMGRLGSQMKLNISKTLPEFLSEKQIVLLVTDEEYTSDFRNGIYNSVGKEYMLKVKESENGSETEVKSYD